MRSSKAQILSRVHAVPDLRFSDQSLTSASGLIVFQVLFARLDLRRKLRDCCRHVHGSGDFKLPELFLTLIIHITLGYRELDDVRFYRDDPMVLRVLGLRRVPSTATMSRRLRALDMETIANLQHLNRSLILDRIKAEKLSRITLDFDGSVLSTRRHAEGTAVGFNRKRKGERSYYPLLCTVAQTGQIFDALPRPGNVHDSHGAPDFITDCVIAVDKALPRRVIECRLDSAFFSENTSLLMEELASEFTVSVPFERLPQLKAMIEERRRWRRIDDTWSYFEVTWKPKSWQRAGRFVFVRQTSPTRRSGPLQLDLFEPRSAEHSYQVILTNKACSAKAVMLFHHGRGSQEGLIGEAKKSAMMDYIPTRSRAGNLFYTMASIMAHNVTRELQMQTKPRSRKTNPKRAALWVFEKLETMRNKLIRRAGRVHYPDGRLTLTMSHNRAVQEELERVMAGLQEAA
jgi:hypothetical protein